MGGIGFLLVIFLYIVVLVSLVAKAPTLKYKILVLLAVLLIPTADAIYGRIKLHQMCKADGGLKIYKVAHNVEGFMDQWAEPDKYVVEHKGYKFAESKEEYGLCNRVSMQNGELVFEKNVKPKSKYKAYLSDGSDIGSDKLYWRQEAVVETYPEGEVIAEIVRIGFRGGWAERFLGSFSDAGSSSVLCKETQDLDPRKLLLQISK